MMSISLFLLSCTSIQREFHFVPYGESFQSTDRPTISCDGRIPGGVTLELTHWTDNETPDNLYANTSTEMALRLAQQQDNYRELGNALVLNNHYDTDGVLSVWACLDPFEAVGYKDLLTQGAEAGDFGEWSSDEGVKLDCAVSSFVSKYENEELAYEQVLAELPRLLKDIQETGGSNCKEMWKEEFEAAVLDYKSLQDNHQSISQGPGRMAIVMEPSEWVSPYALHRGISEAGLWKETTRILRTRKDKKTGLFRYRYEMPGYGWVKKLVDREMIPPVDGSKLVAKLGDGWTSAGGLVGICQSCRGMTISPEEVTSLLHQIDAGCQ